MYEELIAFLLGKREEFTDDDLDNFIELLSQALEISEDYSTIKKQHIIDSMMDRAEIRDNYTRSAVSSAIGNILRLDWIEDEGENNEAAREEKDTPLRSRKFMRGARPRTDDEVHKINSNMNILEESKVFEQEDLLRSDKDLLQGGADTEEKRMKIAEGGAERIKPSEIFASIPKESGPAEAPQSDAKMKAAVHKNAKMKTNEQSSALIKRTGTKDEYEFDISTLESNHADGPSVEFDL